MSRHGVILLTLIAVSFCTARAQFIPTAQDARQGALGGCLISLPDSKPYIGIGWRQGFMANGLATRTLNATIPILERGLFFGRYTHFGDHTYHEQQATAGVGLSVNNWITTGIYVIYSHIGTDDAHYDSQQSLDGGIALQATASKNFTTYLTAHSRRWDSSRVIGGRLGATYRPSEGLLAVVEMASDEHIRFRGGVEYTYNQAIAARIGIETHPLSLTFGVGYSNQRYHIGIATKAHSVLGLSPHLSLGLCL